MCVIGCLSHKLFSKPLRLKIIASLAWCWHFVGLKTSTRFQTWSFFVLFFLNQLLCCCKALQTVEEGQRHFLKSPLAEDVSFLRHLYGFWQRRDCGVRGQNMTSPWRCEQTRQPGYIFTWRLMDHGIEERGLLDLWPLTITVWADNSPLKWVWWGAKEGKWGNERNQVWFVKQSFSFAK